MGCSCPLAPALVLEWAPGSNISTRVTWLALGFESTHANEGKPKEAARNISPLESGGPRNGPLESVSKPSETSAPTPKLLLVGRPRRPSSSCSVHGASSVSFRVGPARFSFLPQAAKARRNGRKIPQKAPSTAAGCRWRWLLMLMLMTTATSLRTTKMTMMEWTSGHFCVVVHLQGGQPQKRTNKSRDPFRNLAEY